jgi:hypothetical protein
MAQSANVLIGCYVLDGPRAQDRALYGPDAIGWNLLAQTLSLLVVTMAHGNIQSEGRELASPRVYTVASQMGGPPCIPLLP